MKRNIQLAILFLAAALAATAQESTSRVYHSGNEWIEESTGTFTAAKIVRVKTSGGVVRVQGGQQNNITYIVRKRVRAGSEDAARREFTRLRVSTTSGADAILLRGEGENYSHGSIDFEVHVPNQTAFVKMETGGGPVSAMNVLGKIDAMTGGGAIQLDQIGAVVHASTGGGDINIGKVSGDVRAETGGGSIHIVSADGQVIASSGGGALVVGSGKGMKLDTGGGSIQVSKCTGEIKASTGGGAVQLDEVAGHAEVETGGGAIKVGPLQGGIRAETGGGPIIVDLSASRGAFSDSHVETPAGDIVVYIPSDLAITIRAAVEVAHGNGINSDFADLKITRGNQQWGPREVFAEGNLNGGGPVLRVHTTTGTIEFKRKDRR